MVHCHCHIAVIKDVTDRHMDGPVRCSCPAIRRKERVEVKIFLEQVSEYQLVKKDFTQRSKLASQLIRCLFLQNTFSCCNCCASQFIYSAFDGACGPRHPFCVTRDVTVKNGRPPDTSILITCSNESVYRLSVTLH